jgi:hypothetical protein
MNAAKQQSPDDSTTCPWCSASIPAEAARCPSCGAALRDGADGDVLGVTQVDLAATSRLARVKQPGLVATWLGAERTTDNPELSGRIEPPSEEVRKEMLKLELAAIDAEIEAKTAQLEAERALAPDDAPAAPAADAPAAPAADGPAATAPESPVAPEDPPTSEPA